MTTSVFPDTHESCAQKMIVAGAAHTRSPQDQVVQKSQHRKGKS